MDWQQELARRRRVKSRGGWATIASNAVGAMLLEIYFVLYDVIKITPTETNKPNFSFLWVLLIAVLLGFGTWWGSKREKLLNAWYLSPEPPSAPPSPEVQRQALHASLDTVIISMVMWGTAGLISGIASGLDQPGTFNFLAFLVMFLQVTGLSGGIAVILLYFIVERTWMPEIPLFFPDGQVTQVRAFRMTVRRRLMVLFTLQSIPLLLLATVAYSQALGIAQAASAPAALARLLRLEVFLVGVGMLSSLILALTLGRYLIQSVEILREHMDTVQKGDLDAHIPITSNDEFGELAEGFNAMVKGLQQEETIRALFSLYVTPEVAEHAIAYGAALGGQLAQVTVLFSDIRGFTSMTEAMIPEALIALLNRYFDVMSDAVIEHGGLINKFGGDSLLAVFGTPLNPTTDHASQAVLAAQGMLAALDTFNADQSARNEPTLRIGIGVASGAVVAGNVGSEERLEYTVIGDTVNLASRLESMTKEVGQRILISETTTRHLPDSADLVPIGEVAVRGKKAPVRVFTLA